MCHRHSAKTKKHSAKVLPSVTLGKQHTTSIVSANISLLSVFFGTRQTFCRELKPTLDEKKYRDGIEMVTARLPSVPDLTLGKPEFFAECPISDTRQTCHLCRVSNPGHSANLPSLSSVKYWTLGKDRPRTYKCWLFGRVS